MRSVRHRKRGFCVCNRCTLAKAREHIDGDHRYARDWSCQCGACRIARKLSPMLEIERAAERLKDLELRLATVRAMKAE